MHERLAGVVSEHFEFEHYVDDNMRNIPDHYHAHAPPSRRLLRPRPEAGLLDQPAQPLILTVDLGTSGPKVASFTVVRRRSSTATFEPVELQLSPVAAREQRPADWWSGIVGRDAARCRSRARARREHRRRVGDVAVVGHGRRSTRAVNRCTTRSSGWIRAARSGSGRWSADG